MTGQQAMPRLLASCPNIPASIMQRTRYSQHDPFGLLVAEETKTGKITFVKQWLADYQVMINPPPENVDNSFTEHQDTFV